MLSSGIHTRKQRRLQASAGAVLFVAAVGVLVGAVASPASAHDALVGTDPAANSSVATLPSAITLTFSDIVIDEGDANQVRVTDSAGTSLAEGAPQVQDNVVTQKLKDVDAAPGAITVLWRVVSRDGHPVSNSFTFTLTGASSSSTPSSSPAKTTPTPVSPTATPTAANGGGGLGSAATPWIILGALTIAAIAGTAYLVVSRGRRSNPPAAAPEAESEADSER